MKEYNSFLKKLLKAEDMLLILCLGVMGTTLFLQVAFRYFFQVPLMWSEELARYLQIWITFLGIGYGIRNESHISMVLVYDRLPKIVKNTISIFSNLIIMFCFIYFIQGAWRFVADQNMIHSSAMKIRMSLVYFVLPLGGFIYLWYMAVNTYARVKSLFSDRGMNK